MIGTIFHSTAFQVPNGREPPAEAGNPITSRGARTNLLPFGPIYAASSPQKYGAGIGTVSRVASVKTRLVQQLQMIRSAICAQKLERAFQSLINEQQSLERSTHIAVTGGDDLVHVLLVLVDKLVCVDAYHAGNIQAETVGPLVNVRHQSPLSTD